LFFIKQVYHDTRTKECEKIHYASCVVAVYWTVPLHISEDNKVQRIIIGCSSEVPWKVFCIQTQGAMCWFHCSPTLDI